MNNAGVMGEKEGWRLCMDINLNGVIYGSNLAFQKMGIFNVSLLLCFSCI